MTYDLYHDFEQIDIRGWLVDVTVMFTIDVIMDGRERWVNSIDHTLMEDTLHISPPPKREYIKGALPTLCEIYMAVRTDSQTLADWYEMEGR